MEKIKILNTNRRTKSEIWNEIVMPTKKQDPQTLHYYEKVFVVNITNSIKEESGQGFPYDREENKSYSFKDSLEGLVKETQNKGISLPIFSDIVDLAYMCWGEICASKILEKIDFWFDPRKKIKERPEFEDITYRFDGKVTGLTGLLYIPSEGVYIQDNPPIENGKIMMKKDELAKKLEEKDKTVRFVPFGFMTGYLEQDKIESNELIKELIGENNVHKLIELPWLMGFGTRSVRPQMYELPYAKLAQHCSDEDKKFRDNKIKLESYENVTEPKTHLASLSAGCCTPVIISTNDPVNKLSTFGFYIKN